VDIEYHVTKEGNEIKLKDLELSHLENIIKMIERKAESGILIQYGGIGVDIDELWYGEEFIKEEDVLEYMN
jgi:7,8-dihydro-6-hydroxymethylpterin-pyrophosphokinase